jgi:hypothetical protein
MISASSDFLVQLRADGESRRGSLCFSTIDEADGSTIHGKVKCVRVGDYRQVSIMWAIQ